MEIDVKGKVWNGKSWKENQERKNGQWKNQAYLSTAEQRDRLPHLRKGLQALGTEGHAAGTNAN